MTDQHNDDGLDALLRRADPIPPGTSPDECESRTALARFRMEHPGDTGRPRGGRTRWARPRMLAGGTVALGATATAVTLGLGAASSSPAFAVDQHNDGSVTIKLFRPAGVPALDARLAKIGVRVQVLRVPRGVVVARCGKAAQSVTLAPGKIPAGRAVYLGADGSGHIAQLPPAVVQARIRKLQAAIRSARLHGAKGPIHVAVGAPGGPAVQWMAAGAAPRAAANTSTASSTTTTSTADTTSTTDTTDTSTTSTDTSTTGAPDQVVRPVKQVVGPNVLPPPVMLGGSVRAIKCAPAGAAGSRTSTSSDTTTSDTTTSITGAVTNR